MVTAYPTISLYKGCKKTEKKGINPISYWSVREADDLYRWLKENSYYSIPKKNPRQPDGTRSTDPAVAAAEQVGDVDPLGQMGSIVM